MGDKIEITTVPKQFSIFYRISSGALMFDVKAAGFAAVGLSSQPLPPTNIWVGIGCTNDKTWIGRPYDNNKIIQIPNLLSRDEYRSFILTWNNDCIRFGRKGETNPLLALEMNTTNFMYVTFSITEQGRESANWRFELPPILEKPIQVPVEGGAPVWVPKTKTMPDNALVGGHEREPLYIMRAPHNGSLTCGKLVPSEGVGYLSWGGEAHLKKDYEILCGYNVFWSKTMSDKIPPAAVIAGHSEVEQETLYVGRAEHEGHLIPGKVQPSHEVCYIPYMGREIAKKYYEILVCSDEIFRCAYHRFPYVEGWNVPEVSSNYYVEDHSSSEDSDYEYLMHE